MHECLVLFQLSSNDLDPNLITKSLDLQPFKIKSSNELHPKWNYWQFSNGKRIDDYVDLYNEADKIVEMLSPYKDKIKELISQFQLEPMFRVIVYLDTKREDISVPAIGFSKKVIEFANEISSEIDVDVYLI